MSGSWWEYLGAGRYRRVAQCSSVTVLWPGMECIDIRCRLGDGHQGSHSAEEHRWDEGVTRQQSGSS